MKVTERSQSKVYVFYIFLPFCSFLLLQDKSVSAEPLFDVVQALCTTTSGPPYKVQHTVSHILISISSHSNKRESGPGWLVSQRVFFTLLQKLRGSTQSLVKPFCESTQRVFKEVAAAAIEVNFNYQKKKKTLLPGPRRSFAKRRSRKRAEVGREVAGKRGRRG